MTSRDLDLGARRILDRARIGVLALDTVRGPLVNPVAFHHGGGALWMTTSRYATKLALARRDPRAAFAVVDQGRSLVIRGVIDSFDPLSISGQLRAALAGPALYWSLGGYALKNSPFLGGYLLDLARIPGEWWPQNRVILRLRIQSWRVLHSLEPPEPEPGLLPGLPEEPARALRPVALAHLCWRARGGLVLAPTLWASDQQGVVVVPASSQWPTSDGVGALVVEMHHRYRATRMVGACLRGQFSLGDSGDLPPLESRYGVEIHEDGGEGRPLRLDIERVTWWQGFQISTTRIRRRARVP